MQILLNDREMDIQLENEENLGEVYDSLRSWVKDAGMFPLSLFLDKEEYEINDDAEWKLHSLESVRSFNLYVGGINSLRQRELATVIDYFLLVQSLVKERIKELQEAREDSSLVQDNLTAVCKEYRHVMQALPGILRLSETEFLEDFEVLNEVLTQVHENFTRVSSAERAADAVRSIIETLSERLREFSEPYRNIHNCAKVLEAILPSCEEAGIALQTGEDAVAYSILIKITACMAKLLRLIDILHSEYSNIALIQVRSSLSQLGSIVDEANIALRNDDNVILADILEYDLHDALRKLMREIRQLEIN